MSLPVPLPVTPHFCPLMKIYYSTMTGNAESLALNLAKKAQEMGYTFPVAELDSVEPAAIQEDTSAVFIVSTWGDGEPSLDAEAFWEQLREGDFNLSRLQYGVFGLGDSSYQEFNAFAKMLDQRLQALGGTPFIERVDADVDYDDAFESWQNGVLSQAQANDCQTIGEMIQ